MEATPGSQAANHIRYWNVGGCGLLAKFPSPAPPRPQTPGFPPRDSTRAVDREWSPRNSPKVVSTFPAAGDSDAWPFPRPAWRVVQEGREPRLRSRLGWEVGLQLTNPQREGWGRGRDRRKSVKLEPRSGKSGKAFKKPPGERNWKRTQGLSGSGLTVGSHSLAHPAGVWGLRGPEGRAPAPDT